MFISHFQQVTFLTVPSVSYIWTPIVVSPVAHSKVRGKETSKGLEVRETIVSLAWHSRKWILILILPTNRRQGAESKCNNWLSSLLEGSIRRAVCKDWLNFIHTTERYILEFVLKHYVKGLLPAVILLTQAWSEVLCRFSKWI